MGMTSLAVAGIATTDEREYDNWLATLTQATERLDELQGVVAELRHMCALGDVVQSRHVLDVLARHRAIT
jgi:hypothetical protein